jgi:uncharacterized Zn-binding protein involved in type VI secretion
MAGPLIRLGDKTSHGGVVIEASPHSDSGGIGIARMGDKTSCPIKGHGSVPIVSGDVTMIVDGKPAARHGDKTACGAVLIAGQQATVDNI